MEAASPYSIPVENESGAGKAHELRGSLRGKPEALGIFLQHSLLFFFPLILQICFSLFPQDSNIAGSQLSLMHVITSEVYSSQGCLNGVLEELPPVPAQS